MVATRTKATPSALERAEQALAEAEQALAAHLEKEEGLTRELADKRRERDETDDVKLYARLGRRINVIEESLVPLANQRGKLETAVRDAHAHLHYLAITVPERQFRAKQKAAGDAALSRYAQLLAELQEVLPVILEANQRGVFDPPLNRHNLPDARLLPILKLYRIVDGKIVRLDI